MALSAPGVEVSVINESFYVPSDAGTTPLYIVASAQDKTPGSGSGTASGTTTANANTVYLITSQRELTETFGDPKFYTDTSSNALHGYELNEYGLQAAYSFLGLANRAYVLRVNCNLTDLVGSSAAPSASAADATYWFDLASSVYGIFEWSQTDQKFTAQSPTLITSVTDLVGDASTGAPKTNVGSQGDYAINTTHVSNKIYYKNASNAWVHLGSKAWHKSHPVLKSSASATVTSGHTININGMLVTSGGTALSDVATAINTANAQGVTASVNSTTSKLEIFHDGGGYGDSAAGSNTIDIEAGSSGTMLADLGITAGTYKGTNFLQAAHTSRPEWKTADENRPNGSVWYKTSTANSGASKVVKLYSSSAGTWSTVSAPLYATSNAAIYNLDPTNGGTSIETGTLYTQFNITEQSITGEADDTPNVGDFQFFRYVGGETIIQSKTTHPTFVDSETFTVQESLKNQSALDSAKTVTMSSSDGSTVADKEDFVTAFAAAGFTNLEASIISSGTYKGAIQIKHTLGGDFRMNDTSGTPLADAGLGVSQAHSYGGYTANSTTLIDNLYVAPTGESDESTTGNEVVASNWKRLSYTASSDTPTSEPLDGQLWYNTNIDEADILVHNGTTWIGYLNNYSSTDPNGPQFSATAPTTQSDATPLVDNDLWVDTSDLENYPKLYRYNTSATLSSSNTSNQVTVTTSGAAWELIDKSDQTTESGIVFADARWHTSTEKGADGNTPVSYTHLTLPTNREV